MFIVVYILLIIVMYTDAYCPPTDSQIAQDQFYKCTRNMDSADQDEDDLLDPEEYESYIKSMVFSLFMVPPFPLSEPLPLDIREDLFHSLVNISGNATDENGDPGIDVYGSNVYEVSENVLMQIITLRLTGILSRCFRSSHSYR
jgi:hypothetical protein